MNERLEEFQKWLDSVSDPDDMSLADYRYLLNQIISECEDRIDGSKLDIDEDTED